MSLRLPATALVLVAALVVTGACAPPELDSNITSGQQIPKGARSKTDDTPAPVDTSTTVAAPPPNADAGITTTATPSVACNIDTARMCFTFEGNTTDLAGSIAPATATGITFAPGKENQAASFTATSQLQYGPNDAFEFAASVATIEAWVNRQDTGGDAVVFDDDGRFSLTILAAGNIICKSSGGAIAGVTAVATNAWAHVACVVAGNTIHAYVNGVEEGSGPGAIASAPTLGAAVGMNSPAGSADGDQNFVGLIDSLRLLKVALTADQIATDAKP